jgi:hypothetical protein
MYAALIFSCMFLPTAIIKHLVSDLSRARNYGKGFDRGLRLAGGLAGALNQVMYTPTLYPSHWNLVVFLKKQNHGVRLNSNVGTSSKIHRIGYKSMLLLLEVWFKYFIEIPCGRPFSVSPMFPKVRSGDHCWSTRFSNMVRNVSKFCILS